MRDVSNPLVYPVIWYKLDRLNYARIDQPLQPRNFGRELSTRITKIGTDIAALLNNRKVTIWAQEDKRHHWVVVTITAEGSGSFEMRFARGVQSPQIVSAPEPLPELGKCVQPRPAAPNETARRFPCSVAGGTSVQELAMLSQAFDRQSKTGESGRQCGENDDLCVHNISISYANRADDGTTVQVDGAEFNYVVAPPIRGAAVWRDYLVLRDKEGTYRSVPIGIATLSNIIRGVPAPAEEPPQSKICKLVECDKW